MIRNSEVEAAEPKPTLPASTLSMSGFVRREMVDAGNIGFGSAASTSLFLIILLSALVFLRLARVRLGESK